MYVALSLGLALMAASAAGFGRELNGFELAGALVPGKRSTPAARPGTAFHPSMRPSSRRRRGRVSCGRKIG